MKILISGASGFIGKHLCESLFQDDHELVGLTRSKNNLAPINNLFTTISEWDGRSLPTSGNVIDGCDVIINLAGESIRGYWTKGKQDTLRSSRLLATRALVDAFRPAGDHLPLLISASATGFYGDRGEEKLTEQSIAGNSFLSGLTSDWEKEALRFRNSLENVSLLRFGVVLGEKGGLVAGLKPIYKLGLGGTLGKGNQWWPWIHIDDVVEIVKFVIGRKLTGPVNVVSPSPERQKPFSQKLAKHFGRPNIFTVPERMIKIAAGGLSEEMLSSRNVIPEKLILNQYQFKYPDLNSALEAL